MSDQSNAQPRPAQDVDVFCTCRGCRWRRNYARAGYRKRYKRASSRGIRRACTAELRQELEDA